MKIVKELPEELKGKKKGRGKGRLECCIKGKGEKKSSCPFSARQGRERGKREEDLR